MKLVRYTVFWIVRILITALCRIDAGELKKLPKEGPFLLVINHINFLEVPLLYILLMPRKMTALVKVENWNNPFFAFLGNLWQGIPIKRGFVDRRAVLAAKEALAEGKILIIAPEGTRSGNGRLNPGFPGIALLAVETRLPVYPLAHFGGESFWKNLSSLKRTRITVKVGAPFTIDAEKAGLNRKERRMVTDEIMRRIAELLPERLRGYYAEPGKND